MNLKYYSFGILGTVLLGAIPIYLIGKPTFVFPLPVYIVLTSMWGLHLILSIGTFLIASLILVNQPDEIFRKRAVLINSAITIGSICWFIVGRYYGMRYQGLSHYLVVLVINLIALAFLWWISISSNRKKTIIYPIALSLFLVWQAFPYFGELI